MSLKTVQEEDVPIDLGVERFAGGHPNGPLLGFVGGQGIGQRCALRNLIAPGTGGPQKKDRSLLVQLETRSVVEPRKVACGAGDAERPLPIGLDPFCMGFSPVTRLGRNDE